MFVRSGLGNTIVGWAAAAVVAAALQGCATDGTPPAVAAAATSHAVAAPVSLGAAASHVSAAPAAPAAAGNIVPVAQFVVPRLDPRALLGMDADALLQAIGRPDNRRQDTPAQVWQYIDQSCVLHVFLYPEAAGRVLRVAYVDAVSRGRGRLPAAECLAQVQRHMEAPARSG